jgi:hypothetical protein
MMILLNSLHRSGLLTYLQDDPNATIETIGIVENPVYEGADFDEEETFSVKNTEVEVNHC